MSLAMYGHLYPISGMDIRYFLTRGLSIQSVYGWFELRFLKRTFPMVPLVSVNSVIRRVISYWETVRLVREISRRSVLRMISYPTPALC